MGLVYPCLITKLKLCIYLAQHGMIANPRNDLSHDIQPLLDPAPHLDQTGAVGDEGPAQGDIMFVPSPSGQAEALLTAPDVSHIPIAPFHPHRRVQLMDFRSLTLINDYIISLNPLSHSPLRLSLLLSLLLMLTGLCPNVAGQVAIPLSQLDPKLPTDRQRLQLTAVFSGQLYVGTSEGLWVIGKDRRTLKIDAVRGAITSLDIGGETLFVGTSEGEWIVGEKGTVTEVKGVEELNRSDSYVVVVGEKLFITTQNKGLWIVNADGESTRVEEWKGRIANIRPYGEQAFIIADSSYWLVSQSGKVIPVKSIRGNFYVSQALVEKLLVVTDVGVWFINKDGEATPLNFRERIYWVWGLGNQVLISTANGSFWLVDHTGGITPIKQLRGWPNDIANAVTPFGERLFLGLYDGFYHVGEDGSSTRVEGVEGGVGYIGVSGGQMYVGTTEGLWVFDKDYRQVNKMTSVKGQVVHVDVLGADTYLVTAVGLCRLDSKVRIKTNLSPGAWWRTLSGNLLPPNWLPSESVRATASYVDENGNDPYPARVSREFSFAKADGEATPFGKFTIKEQFGYRIGWGDNEVQYWVVDQWGNTFLTEKAIYFGVPSQIFLATVPLIFSVLFVVGCFALAPKVDFCHSAIMNPWLRKYFSLGSVPLLLSVFPSLRRHLLRRYSASINKDKEFSEWKKRFVCPNEEFQPDNFGKKLEGEGRLLLTGQSGIGKTSFFKRLTANYASQDKPAHPPHVAPIYIPLTNYGGNSLEELVYNQLFSYGKITDKELAPMFLEQGGLLIFLDGLNEVQNVSDRQRLGAFVEKYWTVNYICVSSQQPYPEVENISKVELKPFSREKVREFISQRVGNKEVAERVLDRFTDQDYQLYSIPRDLDFAVDILNSGRTVLPSSRTELYKITFSSIFAKWKENGTAEAQDNLCERAYTMIVQRDSAFDSVDDPHFKEVTADLLEQKFLVRREGSYNFRHDLIRSYLAAEYFYPRWNNLFEGMGGRPIDSNWLEMLKFSCENIEDSVELKSLIYAVLKRSVRKDLVKDLFEWLKANHPSKCKTWERDFYAKYGELDFR